MSRFEFNTFGSICDEVADELLVDIDSTPIAGLDRTSVEKNANRFSKQFAAKIDIDSLVKTWSFLTIADTTLNDATPTEGDTTFTVTDGSGFPASGALLLDDVYMTFTRSGNVFTVAALPRTFTDSDTVRCLYSVPDNFLRPRKIYVAGREHNIVRRGDSESPAGREVAIYGNYLAIPPVTTAGVEVLIHYISSGGNLESADSMEIADFMDQFVIYKSVARGHRFLYDNDRAAEYEQMAKEALADARNVYAKIDGGDSNMFKPAF